MRTMTFDWLYDPVEAIDTWLAGGLSGAGLAVVLILAALLGLRHATDPDHLVAVTALVSGDRERDWRAAARLGASWGIGHAAILLAVGIPLLLADAAVPSWLEATAERLIGIAIIVLALRMLWRWTHRPATGAHGHAPRSAHQSALIGALHGLGGTGAIVLLLATELPSSTDAILALAIFAPTSILSMTACTALYGRVLTHRHMQRAIPALAVFSLAFGAWYAA
jgi:ABC-type nickel/cobalt efflux system permease component RcnA